ncbi:MAG: hypothetical protein M3126_05470 [Candidatus Eremiobacteraeota bacterium]|nr:hypothetical protein [Candidatus Eremiobacteraeota bacterium]
MSSVALGQPINSLVNINQPVSAANGAGSGTALGPDAFLKLLVTEMQNQDPEKPMDSTQSVAQLAQFSALQAQTSTSAAFSAFQSNFGVMQAATLIGKNVTVNSTDPGSGNTSSIVGTVKTIDVVNGKPQFTMTDKSGNVVADAKGSPILFGTSQITSIGN